MRKSIAIIVLFSVAGAVPLFCRAERHGRAGNVKLSAIPPVIGDWRMVSQKTTLGNKEKDFLDEVLLRIYQRPDGKILQLAVAYGADQRKNFSIHLPEVCYKASGYNVTSLGPSAMNSPSLSLNRVLVNKPDGGVEAVQYWIVLEGRLVTSEFQKRLRHFYFSLAGSRAGGALVRVSSVSSGDTAQKDFETQKEFIAALFMALDGELLQQLFTGTSVAGQRRG